MALPAAAGAAEAGSDAWRFADGVAEGMERNWDPKLKRYRGSPFQANVNMLVLFANARLAGHEGAARRDERIEPIARSLVKWPAYITQRSDLQRATATVPHLPGFTTGIKRPGSMHVATSYQAADALGLAASSGALSPSFQREVARKLFAVADQTALRPPRVGSPGSNQVNWPMGIWLAVAQSGGRWQQAGQQLNRYMRLWVRGMNRPMLPSYRAPNLSSGLGLNYWPASPPSSTVNQTSTTEYAMIIYSGFGLYDEMVSRGMPRLPASYEARMRSWSRRLVQGEWTHGGWPNWDTGRGYDRWQLINYFAWCTRGLLSLAGSGRLASPVDRARASYLLYAALDRFSWLRSEPAQRRSLLRRSTRYGVRSTFARRDDLRVAEIRLGAIAAQAGRLGIERPSSTPDGWSWWDRSRHRLAVSTPAYSSVVITPYSRMGYGGLEPARLLDSQGRVLTTLGSKGVQSGMRAYSGSRLVGSSSRLSRASIAAWRVAGAGSGSPSLAGLAPAISVANRFSGDGVEVTYRLRRGTSGRLRIPFWGRLVEHRWSRGPRSLTLGTVNDEGAKMTVEISSARRPQVLWRSIGRQHSSPRTRRILVVTGLGQTTRVAFRPES